MIQNIPIVIYPTFIILHTDVLGVQTNGNTNTNKSNCRFSKEPVLYYNQLEKDIKYRFNTKFQNGSKTY